MADAMKTADKSMKLLISTSILVIKFSRVC